MTKETFIERRDKNLIEIKDLVKEIKTKRKEIKKRIKRVINAY